MQTVEFRFALDQAVMIVMSGLRGKVVGLYLTEDNSQRVMVRFDGTKAIISQWFPNNELTAVP